MDSMGFLELLPELLDDRAILEQELPWMPEAAQETMTRHLEGLGNSIAFIERLGS